MVREPVQLRPLLRESVRARVRVTSCACGACARPGHGGRRWPRAPAPGHYGLACRSPALARPLQNGHDARERLTLNYIYERFTARTATGHTHDLQSCTRQLSSSSARLTSLDRGGTSRSSIAAAALRESVSVTHCRRTRATTVLYDESIRHASRALSSPRRAERSLSRQRSTHNGAAACGCGVRARARGTGRCEVARRARCLSHVRQACAVICAVQISNRSTLRQPSLNVLSIF